MAYNNELLDYLAAEFGDHIAKSVQENFGGQDIYIRIKPDEKQAYLAILNEELIKQPNPIHAICLMSNHSHEIYSLESLQDFSPFMRRHHGRYGQFFNKKHDRCGKVAQDRPKTIAIEDESHEMMVTFYVHANPLCQLPPFLDRSYSKLKAARSVAEPWWS